MAKRPVVMVVAALAGSAAFISLATFVYLHVVNAPPARLTVGSVTTTTTVTSSTIGADTSGGTSTVTGTWHVAAGSKAGYRVKETLFGQSGEAVGRTSAITGSLTIDGTAVTAASFTADLTTVTSNESRRDSQFQGRIMDTGSFPTATFKLATPIALGTIPADGASISASATGDLTLHGTTRRVTLTVHATRAGSGIAVAGSIPVRFADYGIDNPSGGPATTANSGILEFALNLAR